MCVLGGSLTFNQLLPLRALLEPFSQAVAGLLAFEFQLGRLEGSILFFACFVLVSFFDLAES